MNDLMKLCDKLENCSKNEICYKNKIVCTKAVLQSYINGDALAISCISLIVSATNTESGNNKPVEVLVIVLIILSIVLVLALIAKWGINKFSYRDKWKKYIEVVLEDMEKEKESA